MKHKDWLKFTPKLLVDNNISDYEVSEISKIFHVYIHLEYFETFGFVPGEWVFLVKINDTSPNMHQVISIVQLWSISKSPPNEYAYCSEELVYSFNTDSIIIGKKICLVPLWARLTLPLPAQRIYSRIDHETNDDMSYIECKILKLPYVYPNLRISFGKVTNCINIISIYSPIPSISINDMNIKHTENLDDILLAVNNFPFYYSYYSTTFIYEPSSFIMNNHIDINTLITKFPILDPLIFKEMIHHIQQTLSNHSMIYSFVLHGPSGNGKSLFCNTIASYYSQQHIFVTSWNEAYKKSDDILIKKSSILQRLFDEAKRKSPSIIILDSLDSILSSESNSSMSHLLSLLLSNLYQMKVVVIATTKCLSNISPLLIGSHILGSFSFDLAFPMPDLNTRISLLEYQAINMPIESYAKKMSSWTCYDIVYFCSLVKNQCNDIALEMNEKLSLKEGSYNESILTRAYNAVKSITGSSQHNDAFTIISQHVNEDIIDWNDIGGQETAKKRLEESIEWPLYHSERFKMIGIRSPKGILLYGPPGNSKTLLAKALAGKNYCQFLAIKGPQLFSKWVGESEKALREVFRQARAAAPSILFIDEIDAIGGKRSNDISSGSSVGDRLLTQLLIEMDGLESNNPDPKSIVFIIAATNRPDILDPALVRPGRLDKLIYIPLPDFETRKKILEIQKRKMNNSWRDVSIDILAEKTKKYSGAELVELCQIAGMIAMHRNPENVQCIEMSDFEQALLVSNNTCPRTSDSMISYYERFSRMHCITDRYNFIN